MKVYSCNTAGDHQGLIIDEDTGRTFALTYEPADARTIADALNQSAQLRAENERLYSALNRCVPWMGRLIVDGGHLKCVAPNDAVGALEQAEAALGKVTS